MHSIPYTQQIVKLGITFHHKAINLLIGEIKQAIADGRIRSASVDKFSIFDFISEVLQLKNERDAWIRFVEADPQTVAFSDSFTFNRSNGRKGNAKTPVAGLDGLIYIGFMASCKYSQKLRSHSATLIASDLFSDAQHDPIAPTYDDPCFPYSVSQLTEVANYSNDKYSRAVIRRDFVERLHYVIVGREMRLTDKCLMLAINSSRSKRGIEYNKLPMITISPAESITYHQAKSERKINSRLLRRSRWECEGQLSLNLFPDS